MTSLSAHLDRLASQTPPGLVYQYTSAQGAMGILASKKIWASNVAMLNDTKEIGHAVDVIRQKIDQRAHGLPEGALEHALLASMRSSIGTAARYYYVASFSEEPDLLSQWRSYCPPGGGYAVGIPGSQLANIARSKNFLFVPCVYEWSDQWILADEMIATFVASKAALSRDDAIAIEKAGWEFGQHVGRYGLMLKHPSWREEKEWRLISPQIYMAPEIGFRATHNRIVPYYDFPLTTDEHPDLLGEAPNALSVRAGPNSDNGATSLGLQLLLSKHFGATNRVAQGASEIPFRAW